MLTMFILLPLAVAVVLLSEILAQHLLLITVLGLACFLRPNVLTMPILCNRHDRAWQRLPVFIRCSRGAPHRVSLPALLRCIRLLSEAQEQMALKWWRGAAPAAPGAPR